jgi:hypothetical protein
MRLGIRAYGFIVVTQFVPSRYIGIHILHSEFPKSSTYYSIHARLLSFYQCKSDYTIYLN